MKCKCGEQIPSLRIGNSLTVVLHIKIHGEPIDFSQYTSLMLSVTSEGGLSSLPVKDVTFVGDAVTFTVPGKAQRAGRYMAVIRNAAPRTFTITAQ